jgi:hypothetical protein
VSKVAVGAPGLQEPLQLKQLQAAAKAADLLQELGAGGGEDERTTGGQRRDRARRD